MPLTELFPVVSQLSHQDKLCLIHFLLLAVAKEKGYERQTPETQGAVEAIARKLRVCQRDYLALDDPFEGSYNVITSAFEII